MISQCGIPAAHIERRVCSQPFDLECVTAEQVPEFLLSSFGGDACHDTPAPVLNDFDRNV